MFQRLITILLLTAIAVQAVFGGLQDNVSICLGGGHEHEVAEVIEQCEMECSHHSQWPTPVTSNEDIDNCECTDLEFALINLLSIPRDNEKTSTLLLAFLPISIPIIAACSCENSWLAIVDYPPVVRQQLIVLRTTRLLI